MSGKAKQIEILKNEAESQVRIFWQNLMFWFEIFKKWIQEIFCKFWNNIQGKVSKKFAFP